MAINLKCPRCGYELPRTPALVDAYLTEFARHAATPPDRAAFGATFARCAILNVLWNLGCEPADCRHLSFVDPLLDELEHIGRLLDTEAGTASSTPGAALAEG